MFENYNNKVNELLWEYQNKSKELAEKYQMDIQSLNMELEIKKLELFNEYQAAVQENDKLIAESVSDWKEDMAQNLLAINDMNEKELVEYAKSLWIKASVKDVRKDTEDKIISKLAE